MPTEFIDLSHTISNGTITYKGLPAPLICDFLSRADSRQFYEGGTEFQIGRIDMVSNTGTYLDCPFHRYENGDDLAALPLERLAGLEAVLIHVPHADRLAVTETDFEGLELYDKAVLVQTGWDEYWGTDQYFEKLPYLTKHAAFRLKDAGVRLVGIDSHNIDNTEDKTRPVHTILLGAGILIVEHLCNLRNVPDKPFRFTALPPKFRGVGTFPVRAMAAIEQ